MPRVSIIIPIFAVDQFIEASLTSAMRQTFRDIEILCIDDYSPDASAAVVQKLMSVDKRIKLIHHATNRGLGAARNTGLQHATGEFIKFLDADDLLPTLSIDRMVRELDSSGSDWIFSAFYTINPRGRILGTRSPFHSLDMEKRGRRGLLDLGSLKEDLNQMWPSAWHALWRHDNITRTSATFPEGLLFEDHEFFYTHGFGTKLATYLPEPLYYYRIGRADQITNQTSLRIYDVFSVLLRLKPIFGQHLGQDWMRIYCRTCVRLICERTWPMDKTSAVYTRFSRFAQNFLAQFSKDQMFQHKDWYIRDEDLSALLCR